MTKTKDLYDIVDDLPYEQLIALRQYVAGSENPSQASVLGVNLVQADGQTPFTVAAALRVIDDVITSVLAYQLPRRTPNFE